MAAFRPSPQVGPSIEMLMRSALADQERANSGEYGGPDIRPTMPMWERPDMAEVPFAQERGMKMPTSVLQQVFEFLKNNPISFQSGGDRSRGFSFTPPEGPRRPNFNERQEAAAAARNAERGAQFASGLKDRAERREAAGKTEARLSEYRREREIGREFNNPRLTTEEREANAAASTRGRLSVTPPKAAKPVKVGGPLPTLTALAGDVSYRARNKRTEGKYAEADSLDAISSAVRKFHANLRQATSTQEIDDLDMPDGLTPDQEAEIGKAVQARRRQVSGG